MKIRTWQIISVIFCFILGTSLHFVYKLSGENSIIAMFSSINESTWEHLKLVFFPMIIIAIIGFFVVEKKNNNYWFAQMTGIICSMRIYNNIFLYIHWNYWTKFWIFRYWFFFCKCNARRICNI